MEPKTPSEGGSLFASLRGFAREEVPAPPRAETPPPPIAPAPAAPSAPPPPSPSPDLARLTARLEELERRTAAPSPDLARLTARLEELERRTAAPSPDLARLTRLVEDMERRSALERADMDARIAAVTTKLIAEKTRLLRQAHETLAAALRRDMEIAEARWKEDLVALKARLDGKTDSDQVLEIVTEHLQKIETELRARFAYDIESRGRIQARLTQLEERTKTAS